MKKRMKLFLKAVNPPVQDDLDLETWLKMKRMKDEKSSLVVDVAVMMMIMMSQKAVKL